MDYEIAINLAIDNLIKEGLNDIYPSSFEIELLKDEHFRNKIFNITLPKLKKQTIDEMDFLPLQFSYFPKKEAFDFRKAALIQPWDVLKYLSLVLLCTEEIEKSRIPSEADMVFSYRYNPKDGYLFDLNYNYKTFSKNITKHIKEKGYKLYVIADIANYYDRLNLHRLENILLSYCSNKKIVRLINSLLLFWSNRDSYGLPVGSNASRILAEAELIEIDSYLISKNIDFIRYVDDYRIFANDAKEAHYLLNLFIDRLALEGLSVNTGKTSIERAKYYTEEESEEQGAVANEEKTAIKPQRLIVGYSGLIPTKFREPSQSEIKSFQDKDFGEIKNSILNETIIKPENIRNFVKFIAINSKWEELSLSLEIIDKFPQFILYISDMLIKYKNVLSTDQKNIIKSKFLEILQSPNSYPEYIYTACVTVLTDADFLAKYDILNFYRDIRRSMGAYIGRYTLDRLNKLLTRGEILEIRNNFDQVGFWEKRAIINITKDKLDEEECRPWFKNIRSTVKIDPFSENLLPGKNKV